MAKADSKVLVELYKDCADNPYYSSSKWIIERIPDIFQGDYEKYIKTKQIIADKIEVDSCCVVFVGSSCTGFSLNPEKDFRMFNAKSDIDIAIISSHYFTLAWRCIRQIDYWHQVEDTQKAINDHVTRLIYWGTVATDRILGLMPFAKKWLSAINTLKKIDGFENREIHFRLYQDFESLRAYHLSNIKKIAHHHYEVQPTEIRL